jgi:hypothetical protein
MNEEISVCVWWAWGDSNLQPSGYERGNFERRSVL